MQPELPWNVAGIAPEAREAARASARREGLSVGEWLTRRILRGLSESGGTTQEWWLADSGRMPSNENPVRNGHDRSQDGVRTPHRPDEDRRQSRSALGEVAAPIKFPVRNDSQNAEQVHERIVRLDARLARMEIRAAAEEAKHAETIKALQARTAELTEQISRAAAHSTTQDTQLARTIEAVTEKLVQFQGEAAEQRSTIDGRIGALSESTAAQNSQLAKAIEAVTEKFLHFQGEAAERQNGTDARLATLAEDTASMSVTVTEFRENSERQLLGVEDRIAATEAAVEAVRRDAGELDRMGGSLDHLKHRFEASETEYLNNVERIETRLTRIEANSGEATIDRRLQGIEQTLADMAKLIEKNAPEKPAAIDASKPSEPAYAKRDAEQTADAPPRVSFGTAAPILDLPPFPDKSESSFAPPPRPEASSPASDLRVAANSDSKFDDTARRPISAEVESFLAAARRNTNAGNSEQPRTAPFSWVDPAGQKRAEATHTRLILVGGLGLLVLAAIGMGLYLSNTQGPNVAKLTTMPAHHAVVVKVQRPVAAQPLPRATRIAATPTSPARSTVAGAALDPVQAKAGPQAHATGTQERFVPPAAAPVRASPAATPAKPLTPFTRLAALANAGHAKAQEVLGLEYLDGDGVAVNEAEGAKWLERAAAHGEAVAAYRLGTLYERGHGVAADAAKAAQWYAVAAKAGNRKAMHNLAVAYAQGAGVQKDLPLAAQWFSRAANLGLADSQFNLAVLYERGLGVPQSLAEAYKWYAIAAAQGDAGSRTRVEAIATQIRAGDKAAADKAATQFQPGALDRAANAPPVAASLVNGA